MKPAKEIVPHIIMVILGILVMVGCFKYLKDSTTAQNDRIFKDLAGIIRVIVALAASSISIALPGFIELQTDSKTAPIVKAGGALAVFVLVYLFNPIN